MAALTPLIDGVVMDIPVKIIGKWGKIIRKMNQGGAAATASAIIRQNEGRVIENSSPESCLVACVNRIGHE
ncbi:MAG: hypothetical protein IPK83_11655 [Planctomycetes bacterium]|nr:hypothetical protein [Planctomycetota bacterium]